MGDAKRFLNQVKLCNAHIDGKLAEIARLKDLTLKITSTVKSDPVSGTRANDKMGTAIARIIDLEREINERIDAFVVIKRQVEAVVERVDDPNQVSVLYKHYFAGMELEDVATDMGYSYRNVCYIHGRALQTVEKLLQER